MKVIVYIFFVVLITLFFCIVFIKPKVLDFKLIDEFQKVNDNKDKIEEMIIRTETLLGKFCYKIDVNKGFKFLNNIVIKKESNSRCMDSDMYLVVYFEDGESEEFYFECGNFVYDGLRYKLKKEIKLYNKDEYIPDIITDDMMIISNDDKIECR